MGLLKVIQNFDFTQQNPKVVYLQFDEKQTTFEDSVFLTFLSLAGFDVVIFCPTGYQGPEAYYNDKSFLQTHDIGEYKYYIKPPKGLAWKYQKFITK